MPTKITPHDFTQYLHELLEAKAQQQVEPVRLLFAEYQGVLAHFPHLQPEVDKLLQAQTGRDYEQLVQALKLGLQGLEKLVTALIKAHDEQGLTIIETDDIASLAELLNCRMANQILQKSVVAKRSEQERASKKSIETVATESTQQDSEKHQPVVNPKKRKLVAEQASTTQTIPDIVDKRVSNAEGRFTGWQKIGKKGETLLATSPHWAAVIEEQTKLMWAVNWRTEDKFPNCRELTWFNPDMATNGGDEGHNNGGKNIHDWLSYVNKTGWCGFHDWRLPTLLELKGLLTSEISQYYHIREDVFTDMQSLGSRFWTSSVDESNKEYAWAMYFGYGHDGLAHKSYTLNVRLVRSV